MENSADTPATGEQNTLFPVFLRLERLETLVVGGGKVALEKLTALLSNAPAAGITLVAPEILGEIKDLASHHANVTLSQNLFSSEYLERKDLVIIATGDAAENKRIRDLAKARKILVNVADTPELCDFYLSSIVRKGSVKIAISTNGKSPTVAKRLREVLTAAIPDEMEAMLSNLEKIRKKLKGDFASKVKKLNEITAGLVD